MEHFQVLATMGNTRGPLLLKPLYVEVTMGGTRELSVLCGKAG